MYFLLQFTQFGCKRFIAPRRIDSDTPSSLFIVFAQIVMNFVAKPHSAYGSIIMLL